MPNSGVMCFWDHGLLMRRWKPDEDDENCQLVQQIVLPSGYRTHVLKLAHEHVMSGHLGVTKTYHRVSRYFYWPGIKSAVSTFCKACKVCQLTGKPNQRVPVAALMPIPVTCEPFERLIIDCVGPLPKSKAGHQYLLTIMCAATRFPEAVPLRNLKAKAVVKELMKFCSTFGLPKVIQMDRGTNFTSRMSEQILKELDINHQLSSDYHPESQGVIERFHQTLKTMLRSYCVETGKDWDEGLPFLLFAVRETVQESLGYSPAELVFGHVVRGPLKLSEQLLTEHPTPVAIPDYVQSLRQRLQSIREVAVKHLEMAQGKMKARYDQKSVKRSFQPGDSVLALLPTPGSMFQAKFSGPYIVKKKVSDTNYVIDTPDCRCKSRLCHINMLKRYVTAQCKSETKCDKFTDEMNCETPKVPTSTAAMVTNYTMEEDGLCSREVQISSTRLQNSAILNDLKNYHAHLGESQDKALTDLLHKFPSLFSDVPGKTAMCSHDIDVGNASPIKQHPYRVKPQKRNIMNAEVEYMLQNEFAVPSQSPWSWPCLLVPKPDSTCRFCTDFRKVNNVTKADSFPLPRMEDCVDRVGNAKFVTKLDLLKGYWQVPLTPRASEISAFVTPDNFLQYSVLAFGMQNAPATFQRLMYNVLAGVKNCEVYLDDVVIHSHTWTEHLSTLKCFSAICQCLIDFEPC
uniref:Gypsy retrotransposon integrase-like protein 1 n=1 Tax=Cyprinus carpio TaxID=7962 RepID=A0A8C1PH44_CYPCA